MGMLWVAMSYCQVSSDSNPQPGIRICIKNPGSWRPNMSLKCEKKKIKIKNNHKVDAVEYNAAFIFKIAYRSWSGSGSAKSEKQGFGCTFSRKKWRVDGWLHSKPTVLDGRNGSFILMMFCLS
jgi:hypothetical protein